MKNILALLFIFLCGVALYTLTIKGVVGNADNIQEISQLTSATQPFETSHERASYSQFLAITQLHQFDLPKVLADFSTPDVGYFKGKFFSYFPPGISFFIIPFYSFGSRYNLGLVFSFASVALLSVFSLLLLYKILRNIFKAPIWASLAAVIIYGFATTSWSYSNTIYQHGPTVFLLAFAFYSVWKYKQHKALSWLWGAGAWLAYGLSFFFDYPNAILLLPIMVYFLLVSLSVFKNEEGGYKINFRVAILATFSVFLVISGLHLYYNKINFGTPIKFSNTLPRYGIINLDKLENSDVSATSTPDVGGAIGVFHETNVPNSFFELTVAPDKGLFVFSPILLLALLGVYFVIRKGATMETGTVLALATVDFFTYVSFGDPWGGWAFGPRYLIPAMFSCSILVGIALSEVKKGKGILLKLLTFVLFAYSSAVALLGALTTNAVPPKVEAVYFHIKYGFLYDLDYLKQGKSGSFIFNSYASHYMNLKEYFLLIYGALLLIMFVILFIISHFEKDEPKS